MSDAPIPNTKEIALFSFACVLGNAPFPLASHVSVSPNAVRVRRTLLDSWSGILTTFPIRLLDRTQVFSLKFHRCQIPLRMFYRGELHLENTLHTVAAPLLKVFQSCSASARNSCHDDISYRCACHKWDTALGINVLPD